MRRFFLFVCALIFLIACNPQDKIASVKKENVYHTAPYSLEYLEARYTSRQRK